MSGRHLRHFMSLTAVMVFALGPMAVALPVTSSDVTRDLSAALTHKKATADEKKRVNAVARDSYNDFDHECATYTGSCRFGKTSAKKTVLLLGDSHAQMWLPAVIGTFGAKYAIESAFEISS